MSPRLLNRPADVVELLPDHGWLWTQSMAATPRILLNGLAERVRERRGLRLMQLHTERMQSLARAELAPHLRHHCFFVGAQTRPLVQQGHADYVPMFLSELPLLFRRGEQPVDVALIQVSPPDRHGLCTLGISVEATKAACERASTIIAHINPRMPRTHGDSFIRYDDLTAIYEASDDLPLHETAVADAVNNAIGQHVASLIVDGACLQMGIGAIPDAVLACLGNHRDLGVHSEMFSDGVLELVARGVITNSRKQVHPGKLVATFVMGSQRLYDFVDDNPVVVLLEADYVNDTRTIRRNHNVVAINSALQVDLTGQICADSIGTKIYSGVGGQMDFMRGAALSDGGKAIIALPSTAAGGAVSRIAPVLTVGAGVVTTRAHAQYVVTEFGIADLRGKSLRERASALIAIAHPAFRDTLQQAAAAQWQLSC
ncbi:acetyl-CoA hydrolase/transferase family protein [Permianibacter sp. IMCC34836]|uniref:acetyl-CoA hydrolase/transferase family protein n=1 Tax=Permianibacter fluminis TaxID=2738515 RepID=UPI001553354C|nr:acetyl-CoA hydrolase/transferase family protein [Permianibacter fluminis]NQD36377.1 acetyl-CoA hydrolase/transferase family protein [Permianibacter fluminis]